ncbi:hypothetical protein BaRGS_00011796, partial [Batillaria attramentaria]
TWPQTEQESSTHTSVQTKVNESTTFRTRQTISSASSSDEFDEMKPWDERYVMSAGGLNQFNIEVEDCSEGSVIEIPGIHGEVRDSVVMVSFPVLDLNLGSYCIVSRLQLSEIDSSGTEDEIWTKCGMHVVPAEVYNSTVLILRFVYNYHFPIKGFKMVYSFHQKHLAPRKVGVGMFNCSVPHYSSFQQHLDCNLDTECEGGEDEGEHCPFSPPGCNGTVGYKNKCYVLKKTTGDILSQDDAERECVKLGGRLAMMKTRGEWESFLDIIRYGRQTEIYSHIGMTTTDDSMSDIYRFNTRWSDNTITYGIKVSYSARVMEYKKMPSLFMHSSVLAYPYLTPSLVTFACQFEAEKKEDTSSRVEAVIQLKTDVQPPLKDHFVICPSGHATYDFLSCMSDSDCGASYPLSSCFLSAVMSNTSGNGPERYVVYDVRLVMFICDDQRNTLHYTLVCDFRRDCEDGSDEDFCHYRNNCTGFTCSNGQCVDGDKRCDFMRNCVDGSDENFCDARMSSIAEESKCQYNYLGRSGLLVSNVCLGAMTFGPNNFGTPGQLDEAGSHNLINRFVEWGGNFIDTADIYGRGTSEKIVGSWLARQERDRFVIATKARQHMDLSNPNAVGLSRRHITRAIGDSLERLQTDYVDLYQIHIWDDATPLDETLMALNDLVRSGKVRYLGASNLNGWQLQKVVDLTQHMGLNNWVSLQQQYNLLARHSELEPLQVCKLNGIGVMPWSPLKAGYLAGKVTRGQRPEEGRLGFTAGDPNRPFPPSHPRWDTLDTDHNWRIVEAVRKIAHAKGKSMAQVSLRWLLQKPVVTSVIIGATKMHQLDDNMGAANGWELTKEEMKELDEVSAPDVPYPYDMIWKHNASRNNPWNPTGYV